MRRIISHSDNAAHGVYRTMEKSGVCYRAVERCPARLGNAVGHGYGFGYVVADVVVAYEVVDMALDEGLTYLVVDT